MVELVWGGFEQTDDPRLDKYWFTRVNGTNGRYGIVKENIYIVWEQRQLIYIN